MALVSQVTTWRPGHPAHSLSLSPRHTILSSVSPLAPHHLQHSPSPPPLSTKLSQRLAAPATRRGLGIPAQPATEAVQGDEGRLLPGLGHHGPNLSNVDSIILIEIRTLQVICGPISPWRGQRAMIGERFGDLWWREGQSQVPA